MEYRNEIIVNIALVNKVLQELNAPLLLENDDYFIDDMSFDGWLKIDFKPPVDNMVSFSMIFTPSGLEIILDRVAEAIEWSHDQLQNSGEAAMITIKKLLTSYLLVEYYGQIGTHIRLFNSSGEFLTSFKYNMFFFLRRPSKSKLFMPIYSLI
jgi:hypothetical protein